MEKTFIKVYLRLKTRRGIRDSVLTMGPNKSLLHMHLNTNAHPLHLWA